MAPPISEERSDVEMLTNDVLLLQETPEELARAVEQISRELLPHANYMRARDQPYSNAALDRAQNIADEAPPLEVDMFPQQFYRS